ncbi:[protein-PII] uridylyltransferase [Insolitispirillum peregrinum]|uniref:[protein-PII] uridylyltransferase n=1 Tax=Insolitispirillum peregrinum TaxID=80876 RepID=UPI00361DA8E5
MSTNKTLRKPREIIDRKELVTRLDEMATSGLSPQEMRKRLLAELKDTYRRGHEVVRQRCLEGRVNGALTVSENCYLMDQLVVTLYDFVTTHVYAPGVRTKGEKISLLAVGGYGRGELSPYSDIDLLFLLPYKSTPYSEQVVEYMLYILWDLGLKVGHSTRSIDECIRLSRTDITIRTALLEARWLWGDRKLADEFKQRYRAEVIAGSGLAFVEAKLAERDARHDRLGDSRYLLEPNVKEDKGGLRDLHTLFWIAKYLYNIQDVRELVDLGLLTHQTAQLFIKAQTFLWSVRCLLHYLTNRGEDRLTFDMQKEIATRLGYTDHAGAASVERFMKHYFLIAKDVGDLTRIFCAVLEEHNKRKPRLRLRRPKQVEGCFLVDGDRLNLKPEMTFEQDPLRILRLFRLAQTMELDIHPNTLRQVHENLHLVTTLRSNPEANSLFLDILCDSRDAEGTLRHLNEAGVFGRFLPDFGKVVAQMQYDMYHVYTTDEHTIRAIGTMHRIEQGTLADELPLSTSVMPTVQSRRALYVAVMLHDIAKGRGGDHSELGAKVAQKLCPRLGLTPEETETVAWLVLHHLDMSRNAFKRDIDDPQTIADFSKLVQSPERLKLLLLLTCADIRAVGPQVWNGWKAALLRELYYRTIDALSGNLSAEARDVRVSRKKDALRASLSGWSDAQIERHLALGYPSYWLMFDTSTHQQHARMIRRAEDRHETLTIDMTPQPTSGVLDVTVLCPDHPGLFARITGAISLLGCSIVDAKIITLTNGMALDSFSILDPKGELPTSHDKQRRLSETIEQVLTGKRNVSKELVGKSGTLPQRAKVFTVPPRVIVDNSMSKTHTVIEVNGRDRPGFLYDVTRTLTNLGLQIGSAHISTYGERVVDVFYVKDIFGMKIDHQSKLKHVREQLMITLEQEEHGPAKRKVG